MKVRFLAASCLVIALAACTDPTADCVCNNPGVGVVIDKNRTESQCEDTSESLIVGSCTWQGDKALPMEPISAE